MENTFQKDARNLAEATLRLVVAAEDLRKVSHMDSLDDQASAKKFYEYAKSDAQGEAESILAKTVGA